MLKIEPNKLRRSLEHIFNASEVDIGCGACMEKLDVYIETQLAGQEASDVLPQVRDHLATCNDCKEEFETLLQILINYPDQ